MERRVELEVQNRNPSEVVELNLDNCRSLTITGLNDEFVALEHLSLRNVGLTSLKGLPKLNSLKRLELRNNRIVGGLNHFLRCPNLERISLTSNRISEINELAPLKELRSLEALDLYENEIAKSESYRADVFNMLPQLKYLDGYDANNVEVASENDEFADEEDSFEDEEQGDEEQCDEDQGDEELDEEDEEIDGEDEEDEEIGLEYVVSSKAVEDEDETEDFQPSENLDASAEGCPTNTTEVPAETSARRGVKRKYDGEEDPDL